MATDYERGRIAGLREAADKMEGFISDTHVEDEMYCYTAMEKLRKWIAREERKLT